MGRGSQHGGGKRPKKPCAGASVPCSVPCISTSYIGVRLPQMHRAHSFWPQACCSQSLGGEQASCLLGHSECVLLSQRSVGAKPTTFSFMCPRTLPPAGRRAVCPAICPTVNPGHQGESRRPPEKDSHSAADSDLRHWDGKSPLVSGGYAGVSLPSANRTYFRAHPG